MGGPSAPAAGAAGAGASFSEWRARVSPLGRRVGDLWRRIEDVSIVGICDKDVVKAQRATELFGGAAAFYALLRMGLVASGAADSSLDKDSSANASVGSQR